MKNLLSLLLLFTSIISFSQDITGDELLEKSIQFHDPNGNWERFEGALFVTMETPKATARKRTVQNAVTQESRTVATNNSGLSIDQQTITTMMTQITQQFQEMERDRITREERQERKNLDWFIYTWRFK
jgi:hypothetical protein